MLNNILKNLKFLIQQDTQNPPRIISENDLLFKNLKSVFAGNGFKVEITDLGEGHVIFYAVIGAPEILFNVHLDTVPVTNGWKHDPFDLTIENENQQMME